MSTKKINTGNFWKWFSANEKLIREVLEDEYHSMRSEVVENLNNYILDFGVFTWEVGEGKSKPYYFLISPNCNPELLPLSRKIINDAPDLGEWEFHAAKQPKNWDCCFNIYDEFMEERSIDASGWKFALNPLKVKAGIVVFTGGLRIDEDTLQRAAEIVVISEIGEEARMKFLDTVTVSNTQAPENASPLSGLRRTVELISDDTI